MLTRQRRNEMITTHTESADRELAHREADGIEVVLFWNADDDHLTVSVSDDRSGSYFELEPAPNEALDAFYHPYSYAAFTGVPYDDELLASWALAASHSVR
jgi:hypothetical protein